MSMYPRPPSIGYLHCGHVRCGAEAREDGPRHHFSHPHIRQKDPRIHRPLGPFRREAIAFILAMRSSACSRNRAESHESARGEPHGLERLVPITGEVWAFVLDESHTHTPRALFAGQSQVAHNRPGYRGGPWRLEINSPLRPCLASWLA